MKIKVFVGKWDSWGFEVSYCHWYKGLTIGLIHWYIAFELWTKEDIEIAAKHEKIIKDILDDYDYEDDEVKPKKKAPAKKKK